MNGSATERGLLGTLGAIAVLLVMAPGAGAITASNTTPISPPDDGSSQSVSPVTISGQAGTVSSVRVVLELPGIDAPGDVDMLLVGPGGQRGIVMSDACGGGSFSNAAPLAFVTGVATVPDNCGFLVVGGTYGPTDINFGPDTFLAPAPAGPYPTGFGAFTGRAPTGPGPCTRSTTPRHEHRDVHRRRLDARPGDRRGSCPRAEEEVQEGEEAEEGQVRDVFPIASAALIERSISAPGPPTVAAPISAPPRPIFDSSFC